jgi:phosphoribosyl 1,2-cyclic phosphodiesterase
MHLPDSSYVSFVTAVITSVTATIGLFRVLLEKKPKSSHVQKVENRCTTLAVERFVITHPDSDHISSLKYFRYYI